MSLHIVGGSYLEKCTVPDYEGVFGSGGRAAASLQANRGSITLHTYCPKDWLPSVQSLAEAFRFDLKSYDSSNMYCFDYFHPASEPRLYPTPKPNPPIEINEPNVLVYGMVEGAAVINADKVVYDPQSPGNPIPFSKYGSKAKRLAIVANATEAKVLSGKTTISEAGVKLLADGADVVVVKRGAFGLTVFTAKGSQVFPAYATERVWPIGSGDVFTAVFAANWIDFGDPFEAAELASMATAHYCDTKMLPVPTYSEIKIGPYLPVDRIRSKSEGEKQVYLAGPFFSIAERWLVDEVKSILESSGLRVFSPLHEVGFGSAKEVAPKDLDGLLDSNVVLALLDGYDPGTMFEIGYAKAANIPVIAYVQQPKPPGITMVEGTDCEIFTDLTTAIYRAIWA